MYRIKINISVDVLRIAGPMRMRSLWPIEWVGEFVTETPSGWRIHRVQFTFDSIVLRVCTIYFRILSNSYIQYYMRRFLLPFKVFAWNMCVCVCIIWREGEKEREEKKVLRKWVRELDDSTVRSIRHMSPYLVVTWTCIFCYLMFAFWFNFTAIYHGNTLLWHFSQIFAEANVRVLSRVKGLFYVIRFMLAVGCIG